jgi:ketosteroid isomerase-like protein
MKRLALPAELTGGNFRTELRDVYSNDSGAVALAHSTARCRGESLDADMCAVFTIRAGRVQHMRFSALTDQYAVDDFWDMARGSTGTRR